MDEMLLFEEPSMETYTLEATGPCEIEEINKRGKVVGTRNVLGFYIARRDSK